MAHQIAVFAENRPGRIERVSRVLGEAGVNIRAITIATADAFGVIKLLVDDPAKAYAALAAGGVPVFKREIVAIVMDDRPGGLLAATEALSAAGINIEGRLRLRDRGQTARGARRRGREDPEAVGVLARARHPHPQRRRNLHALDAAARRPAARSRRHALDVEMSSFLEAFFPLVASLFGPPREGARIARALGAAARAMALAADGARTVDLVFLESLAPAVGLTPDQTRAVLEDFHRDEFEQLARLARPAAGARDLVDRALAAGVELVLATNPVFFDAAIRARVRWAGLADVPFTLVTGAEIMRWTKPHAGYYAQILELTGRRPEECLMAGDDPGMDMAARRAGIATWLVERPGEVPREAPLADERGSLEQLAERF